MKFEPTYPDEFARLAREVRRHALLLGMQEDRAEQLAYTVAEHARLHFGGRDGYIPRGARYDLSQRDREICRRFNGSNARELAERYCLSRRRVCQIIEAARDRLREERERAQEAKSIP